MLSMHLGLIIRVVLSAALAQGYANPGGCSGACNVHDPTLIQRSSDNRYFRFSTGNKISYASASSINGPWTTLGSMLPSGSSIDLAGKDDLWVGGFGKSFDQSCLASHRHTDLGWRLPMLILWMVVIMSITRSQRSARRIRLLDWPPQQPWSQAPGLIMAGLELPLHLVSHTMLSMATFSIMEVPTTWTSALFGTTSTKPQWVPMPPKFPPHLTI